MTAAATRAAIDSARIAAGLEPRAALIETPTLPAAGALFVMDDVQLHDLTYHAVTRYLTSQRWTKTAAHEVASRVAGLALSSAMVSDYRQDPAHA